MKIAAISKIKTYGSRLFAGIRRRVPPELPQDVFEHREGKIFRKIKLKTAEKLYNTEFVLSNHGENVYPTFVLDKKTGKPVEVLVIPKSIEAGAEDFYILNPDDLYIVGNRAFGVDSLKRSITAGSMSSYANSKYQGLGIREHQIAIERMLMKKMKEIKICSIPSAYDFHKKCGFEVIRKYDMHYRVMDFINEVYKYSNVLNLDEQTIRKLMVYKKINGGRIVVDENSSFENFIIYAYKNNIPISGKNFFSVDMRLTEKALQEWKKLISKSPILYGKNLPKNFVNNSLP